MLRRNKRAEREVALERVRRLLGLAQDASKKGSPLSDRYVRLLRRIAMRYQVSLPVEVRRRICRACEVLLVPGRTSRVRIARGRVSVTCLRCDTVKRYPLRPSSGTLKKSQLAFALPVGKTSLTSPLGGRIPKGN